MYSNSGYILPVGCFRYIANPGGSCVKIHLKVLQTTISCVKGTMFLFVYRPVKKLHSAPLTFRVQKLFLSTNIETQE